MLVVFVSEIIGKLQKAAIKSLTAMLQDVLDENDYISGLSEIRDELVVEFIENMNQNFENLEKDVEEGEAAVDFDSLSLVQDVELDTMVAVEGMIAAARNLHLPSFIGFNTRLNSLFADIRIDESINPLDPQQVSSAFSEAMNKLEIDPGTGLLIFRTFNEIVLKNIDTILREANQLLIDHGIIPDLGMDSIKANSAPRRRSSRVNKTAEENNAFGTVEEDPYQAPEEQPQLFSMMQNLLRGEPSAQPSGQPPTGAAPAMPGITGTPTQQYSLPNSMITSAGVTGGTMQAFQPAPGTQVQVVDQQHLMNILTDIQKSLEERKETESEIPTESEELEKLDISESLGEILSKEQDEGTIAAVDQQSSDVINLVTLLYDAIWQDESVPIPIKELIGRTQIIIIKVALSDTTFFNREDHPARMLLNEIAAAGIGWTETEELDDDPLYRKIEELVLKTLSAEDADASFFEELIKDFKSFRAKEAVKTRRLEQRILKAKERQERLEDIHELVTQKINERILGRELHPFAAELLETHFHKFMVMLVVKEGPGSNAWKQSINTIDVLLWSVQPHEQADDRERLQTVNPRLLNNLRKALRIAQRDKDEVEALIGRLMEVQQDSFDTDVSSDVETTSIAEAEDAVQSEDASESIADSTTDFDSAVVGEVAPEPEELSDDDPVFDQIDALSVGLWVEFIGDEDDQSVRCKLAAKINAIDKFIFVNRQGVKVVEKTRTGLARELKDGTVKIISDGLLFSRALESVIGDLRESQQLQQTGSAYQPA